MEYMTAKETAEKWNISQRRVSTLCMECRIAGAERFGNMWKIPISAPKPEDKREISALINDGKAKPFVKWAGGKKQILAQIRGKYPVVLGKTITKYAEPFVGGGAVLFDILNTYKLKKVYISDVNAELINTYSMIQKSVNKLISALKELETEYTPKDQDERKEYYLDKRARFNYLKFYGDFTTDLEKAALFIFLNKTCFNGLYRVNKKGEYNVPMGVYKNPLICDEANLKRISELLKNVKIVCGDYKKAEKFIDKNTFVYLDPPYRPLTQTAAFTAYTNDGFSDKEQSELAEFVDSLAAKGAKLVVSNSDPKNTNVEDNFFDDLYSKFNIARIEANRMINSKGKGRGKISELLIANY